MALKQRLQRRKVSKKSTPKKHSDQVERYSTTDFLKMTFKMAKLTFISYWTKHRILSRITALILVFIIVFTLFIQLYDSKAIVEAYEISGKMGQLLDDPIQLYADKLSVNGDGSLNYNEGYAAGGDRAGDAYSPKFSAAFSDSARSGMSVTDPYTGTTVTFKPIYPLRSPAKNQNRVVYPLIGQPASKVYTLKATGIKEDIIFKEMPATDSLTFEYEVDLPEGTELRLENDNSISVYGVDGALLGDVSTGSETDKELLDKARENAKKTNLLFRIPAPIVFESKDNISSATAKFELKGNKVFLSVEGLKSANYPLSVDPTIYVETARKLMRGNNETNIDFDIDNELIKKGFTTGARFDEWSDTMNLNDGRWDMGTAVAGGNIYAVGGQKTDTTVVTYTTPGADTFVVPGGVTEVTVKLWGAGGGGGGGSTDGDGGAGGGGAFVQTTLSVTPSESLNVVVGGGGGPGTFSTGTSGTNSGDGGGGGGHSEINRSGSNLVVAGGGGGGGGGDNSSGTPGGGGGAGGGNNGQTGSSSSSAPGGGGGGTGSGGSGGNGSGNDGSAGSAEQGGAGGNGGGNNGAGDGGMNNGGVLTGGDGGIGDEDGNGFGGGGGGGSGRYGGGGGSSSISGNAGGGGGGGGSSLSTGTSTTLTGGSGPTPGNNSDSLRSGAGEGGSGGSGTGGGSTGGTGTDGIIIIEYSAGGGSGPRSDVYWAQLSTTDNSIESPNPGPGVCTEWCTNSSYDLPEARAGFSLVAYNGYLYAIGGINGSGTRQDTVFISKLGVNGEPSLWHPSDNNPDNWVYWYESANTLPSATSYAAAVAYANKLYFFGGQTNGNGGGVDDVLVANFSPTGDIDPWSATGMVTLPNDLHMHGVQVYNDRLYLIGGNSNGTLQNTVYYSKIDSDGSINAWTETSSFATARSTWGGKYTVIWGGYVYLMGGCSTVNGSGYCTNIQDDIQIASINADGTLGPFSEITGITNERIGYGLLAWDNALYRIGGCDNQNSSTGECDNLIFDEDYAVINPAGEVSTVNITQDIGNGNCTGGSPYNCDMPPPGDDAGEGGQLLSASTIINGYLYIIGGCIDYDCDGSNPAGDDDDVSGNISYVEVGTDGSLQRPGSCQGTYYGAWCVDSTNRVNGTTGVAAAGITTFNGRIYIVGGFTGNDESTEIFYNSTNSDGSLAGAWSSVDMTSIGMAEDIAYTYAYARANPASAGTNPGNLFIFGGCEVNTGAGCNDYETQVYKCNIQVSGAVAGCTTSGQLQIDSNPGLGGDQGLGIHSGTVYANYIFLIGGYGPNGDADKDDVLIARFDDSNNVVPLSGESEWIESPNKLSIGRRRGWAFGYNGHIYSVGGYDASGGGVIPFIEWSRMNVSNGEIDPFVTSDVTINQRWGLSMVVGNSYAYVIGGCDTGAAPSSCSNFEPSIQTFQLYNNDSGGPAFYSDSANLFGTDRFGGSSAVIDGYIYLAGGCVSETDCTDATNNVQYAALDEYGNVGSWSSTTASLPADRTWGQLETAGGSLYYIGGQDDTATNEQSTVYYSTPTSGDITSWSTASNSLPAERTQFSSAVWNDRIYVTGGLDSGGAETNTVYISPQLSTGGNITSSWSSDTDTFDVARSGHTTVSYANNLYVLGGYDGANYLNDVQFTQINSDGTIDAWTFSTRLPESIRQGDGFVSNGYMYLIGGRTENTVCQSNTLVAPISANTTIASGNNPTGVGEWYETNEKYSGNRYGNATVYHDGKAYVLGGVCVLSGEPVPVIEDDFDATIDGSQWTDTNTTVADTNCDSNGGNSLRFNGTGREAETVDVDVTYGGTISFYLYSPSGGGGSCESPDGGEDMALEYSINNGSNWTLINTYPSDVDPMTLVTEDIPPGAMTDDTRFRWRQTAYSGTTFDHWAIDDVQVLAAVQSTTTVIEDDFDATIDGSQWTDTNTTVADTNCDSNGGNSLRFNGATREAETVDVDVTYGGTISFYLYAPNGGGGSCEEPDGGEDMTLEYSTNNGGSWTPINTYNPTVDPMTLIAEDIPPGAMTDDTRFRWRQTAFSGATFDHWAIDDVIVDAIDEPVLTLTSSNRVVQTTILSQPQVAKYSRLIDTDTNVFPNSWLLNGVDNFIGARWQTSYRSAVDAPDIFFEEEFNGSNGGDLTFGNPTNFTACFAIDDTGTATAEYDSTYFVSPDTSAEFAIDGGASYAGCRDNTVTSSTVRFDRFYIRPQNYGAVSSSIPIYTVLNTASGDETVSRLRINPSGQIQVQDRFTTDHTFSALTIDTWHRIEVGIQNDQMTVELYRDDNLHGSSPDDSVTIDLDSASAPDDFHEARVGLLANNGSDTYTINVDGAKSSATGWVGPTYPEWGQVTNYGDTTLGDVAPYTPLDSAGADTEFARWYFFEITIDSSRTFGYPEDVARGPTITDLSLFFTSDPSKRLRHGKTFTGGEQQPLDTPCRQSVDSDCPLP